MRGHYCIKQDPARVVGEDRRLIERTIAHIMKKRWSITGVHLLLSIPWQILPADLVFLPQSIPCRSHTCRAWSSASVRFPNVTVAVARRSTSWRHRVEIERRLPSAFSDAEPLLSVRRTHRHTQPRFREVGPFFVVSLVDLEYPENPEIKPSPVLIRISGCAVKRRGFVYRLLSPSEPCGGVRGWDGVPSSEHRREQTACFLLLRW